MSSNKEIERRLIDGPAGKIEMEFIHSTSKTTKHFAVVCHPHSLHGGTMHNKVVTTLFRLFRELNIPVARFNFRGVGESTGVFDNGVGELQDLKAVMTWIEAEYGPKQWLLSGFSFGSYVCYQYAGQHPLKYLIVIAPPVHHYPFLTEPLPLCPWTVVQCDDDEVVPAQEVYDWLDSLSEKPNLLRMQEGGHYFHGRLISLREDLRTLLLGLDHVAP